MEVVKTAGKAEISVPVVTPQHFFIELQGDGAGFPGRKPDPTEADQFPMGPWVA